MALSFVPVTRYTHSDTFGDPIRKGPTMPARQTITFGVFLILLFCLPACKPRMTPQERYASESESGKKSMCAWTIVDGLGAEPLGPNGEDSFTLLQEMLFHSDHDMRGHTASQFCLHHTCNGQIYSHVIDAYIDAGRDKDLQAALYRAWQELKDTKGSVRRSMAAAYLDLRRRQYLWANPEVADELSPLLGRNPNPPLVFDQDIPPRRGWSTGNRSTDAHLSNILVELGDEEFIEVFNAPGSP